MDLLDPATGRPNEAALLDRWCRPDGTDRALGAWLILLGVLHALPALLLMLIVFPVGALMLLGAVGLMIGGRMIAQGDPVGAGLAFGTTSTFAILSVLLAWLAAPSSRDFAMSIASAALNVGTLIAVIVHGHQPRVRYRHGALTRFQLRDRLGDRYDALIHKLALTYAPPDTRAP